MTHRNRLVVHQPTKTYMKDISLLQSKVPTMANIKELQEIFSNAPQVEMPVKHHHSDGVYIREIFMPAGTVVVGKEHKTRHLNIILEGKCIIWTVHGKMLGRPGMTFESFPGMKKALYILEDTKYMTVHPTDEQDQDKLEGICIRPEEQQSLFPELDFDILGVTQHELGLDWGSSNNGSRKCTLLEQ